MLLKTGKRNGNNIISKIDDKTQILFRKDTGSKAHPIKPRYSKPVDHYNVEIQKKNGAGKWKSKESFHMVVDKKGNVTDKF